MKRVFPHLVGVVVALGTWAAMHAALRTGAELVVASMSRTPSSALGSTLLAIVLAAVGAFVVNRFGGRRWLSWVLGGLAYVVAFALLHPPEVVAGPRAHEVFPGFFTYAPGSTLNIEVPGQPPLTTTVNAHGFRGADFAPTPAPGVVRGVVLGDSNAFGFGLRDPETLAVQLERRLAATHPGVRFEVLNLGIMGASLHSFVRLEALATSRFQADFVILGAHPDDDYLPWDYVDEWRDRARPSLLSAATLAVGPMSAHYLANWLVRVTLRDRSEDADYARRCADALRSQLEQRPVPFVLLEWRDPLPPITERLRGLPDVGVVTGPLHDAAHVIPNDGHPNAAGSAHVAALLAEALGTLPAFTRRVASAPVVEQR